MKLRSRSNQCGPIKRTKPAVLIVETEIGASFEVCGRLRILYETKKAVVRLGSISCNSKLEVGTCDMRCQLMSCNLRPQLLSVTLVHPADWRWRNKIGEMDFSSDIVFERQQAYLLLRPATKENQESCRRTYKFGISLMAERSHAMGR